MSAAATRTRKPHPVLRRLAYVSACLAGLVVGLCLFSEGEYFHRTVQHELEAMRTSIGHEEQMDEATYSARLKEYTERLPTLLRQMPDAWPTQEMRQEIRSLATLHGLTPPEPMIAAEQPHEFYYSQQYTLEMHGNANELFGFMTDLLHGDAPVRALKGFSLHADAEAGGVLTAKIHITYYRYLPE